MIAEFSAFTHQQLHTEADAHKWFTGTPKLPERPYEPAPVELRHGIAESADAGQYHRIGGLDVIHVGSNRCLQTSVSTGLLNAE